ncbi:MAG: YdeI/OmpD-associated family protein [Fimbriimonadaceae bacterium]
MNVGKARPTIRFEAVPAGGVVTVPAVVLAELDCGCGPVEGILDGFPFRAPLKDGQLVLSEAQCRAASPAKGRGGSIELTRCGDEGEVRVPADLLAGMEAPAREAWEKVTPMARREWVRWVASAKQAQTRARRIEVANDMLCQGKKRPCCFPGINWVTKDLVSANETWIPLP